MGYAKLKAKLSIDDYFEGEEMSPVRHEYLYGEVYAMAGVSQNHSRITRNLLNLLSSHLKDSRCEAYSENLKVQPSAEVFYYPDIVVTCEGDFKNKFVCQEPKLIIEVTSPSTIQIDRREKLFAYQKMACVQEVVVIDQERVKIELHRRLADGQWITYFFSDTDTELDFQSVGMNLDVSAVYSRVTFVPEPALEH
ncbi:MAG: Uma2 family endonuclease [Pyrinomonadaceae bacterium]